MNSLIRQSSSHDHQMVSHTDLHTNDSPFLAVLSAIVARVIGFGTFLALLVFAALGILG